MQNHNIFVTGISHHTASLKERSYLAWSPAQQLEIQSELQQISWIDAHIIIVTCNRTEIIHLSHSSDHSLVPWCVKKKMPADSVYQLKNCDAISHILQNLTGINSMIIGETEIIGQYKKAMEWATIHRTCNHFLQKIMNSIFSHAKKIRQQSNINAYRVSLPQRVFERVNQTFPLLKDSRVLCIGAGAIIKTHLIYLKKRYPLTPITILCKSPNKHRDLCQQFNATIDHISNLETQLDHHNCIISATSDPGWVITKQALKNIKSGPKLLFDLATPQDIHPLDQQSEQHCCLITMDTLGAKNSRFMQNAIELTQRLINTQIKIIAHEQKVTQQAGIIRRFRQAWIRSNRLDQEFCITRVQHMQQKMVHIHKALHIATQPPAFGESIPPSSIDAYSNQLLHLPTLKIKTLIQENRPIPMEKIMTALENKVETADHY